VQVAKGIHRETLGIVNWYLVEEGGRVALVDAGTPADWKLLRSALASLGRTLDDVDAVLLTHAHSDHTGFAERARTEAGASVFVHEADASRAKGAKPPRNETGFAKYLVHAEAWKTTIGLVRRKAATIVPIAEVSTFADGEKIEVPGRPRAVHAPGHTDGSAALFFEDRSVLCTGDSLVTHNPLTGRDGPQIMPSGFNLNTDSALESLAALEATGAGTVLPGHGEPWPDGAANAVHQARAAGPS
jgi:glyoxylase-like metal-dependent hydrolase (beta-lactamase superfamily II)